MTHHIKATIRRIQRNRSISLVSILGLTLGLTVFTILSIYVNFQSTFDHFHQKSDRTYKVVSKFFDPKGELETYGISFGTLAEELEANYPEAEETTRCFRSEGEVTRDFDRFSNIDVAYVDYSFFQMFDFDVSEAAFYRPDQVVVSRQFAETLSGREHVVGMEISYAGVDYQISQVADFPLNSQFQFDLIVPLESKESYRSLVYHSGLEFHTFVTLKPEANNTETLDLLSAHYNASIAERWENYRGSSYLVPLRELHLLSAEIPDSLSQGSQTSIRVIQVLAFFILILAMINYTNFQIAGAQMREREIGLRKVMGASRGQLMGHLVLESLVIVLISGLVSLAFVEAAGQLIDPTLIDPEIFRLSTWPLSYVIGFGLGLILVGVLSGLYPALYLSRVLSIHSSLSKSKTKIHPSILSLIVVQFCISTLLLMSIVVMYSQLDFMKSMPLGFDKENVLIVRNLNDAEKYDLVKNELNQLPGILETCFAQAAPGGGTSGQFFKLKGAADHESVTVSHIRVKENYIKTFDLKLISGDDFDYSKKPQRQDFIVNETAYKMLGSPSIGTPAVMGGRKGNIIGVVKDYHFESLHHRVNPLVFTHEPPYRAMTAIKLSGGSLGDRIDQIQSLIEGIDPAFVMDYYFFGRKF